MTYTLHTSSGILAGDFAKITEAKDRALRELRMVRTAVDADAVSGVIGQFRIVRVFPRKDPNTWETVLVGQVTRTGRIRWSRP
jgi:hypothetical protein